MSNYPIILAEGHHYEYDEDLTTRKDGDWVICLEEVRDNLLPENKSVQVPILYEWTPDFNCFGCKRIIATTNPDLNLPKLRNEKIKNKK